MQKEVVDVQLTNARRDRRGRLGRTRSPHGPALACRPSGRACARRLAAGIDVLSADHVDVEPGHATALVLEPSGRRLEVDRVVAVPALEGRPVSGIPADAKGFIDVDDHCRVRGLNGVWAVGDGTSFPLKSAGVAAEQADIRSLGMQPLTYLERDLAAGWRGHA